jgi:phosphoenolpyruvate carboxylase
LHSDGFVTFFRQATPIDAIEQSRIGSRPSRRTGQASLKDLRAIPWVFAWGQSRFYLSGWYGTGSALKRLEAQDPGAITRLKEQLLTWSPLHYLVSNVATSVTAVDLDVMRRYADLVESPELRDRIMSSIESELLLTRDMMQRLYGGPLMDQRPNVQRMIALRSEGLRILHNQQIELLRTWRAYMRMGETTQAEQMTPKLLLTVNAIASGLGTTG